MGPLYATRPLESSLESTEIILPADASGAAGGHTSCGGAVMTETWTRRILYFAGSWNVLGGLSALLDPSRHLAQMYTGALQFSDPLQAFFFRATWINVIAWGSANDFGSGRCWQARVLYRLPEFVPQQAGQRDSARGGYL
ncbi:MAG: hypothetical protein ABIR70_18090 [Bryobacteraceae bacterium]